MMTLILLWNVLTLMTPEFNALEIKTDPGMRVGQPSYMYCDVGTVTAGVAFYKEPANLQGTCLAPGLPCISTLYTITKNATGALLQIASVDVSRDEGVWYCEHDVDRSINTIAVNNHTIAGFLLKEDWREPSESVQEYTAEMTLSCTNQMPSFSVSYEDSQSNTGTMPGEAVTTTTQSSYDGITCENENKFYVIRLTASNNLAVFNNKQGVMFTFNYYGMSRAAGFSVDFLEA